MKKFMTTAHKAAVLKMKKMGIKTLADIDAVKGCNSRYGWLKAQVGEDGADWMMNDLALSSLFT